jgi:hypothetical protein
MPRFLPRTSCIFINKIREVAKNKIGAIKNSIKLKRLISFGV